MPLWSRPLGFDEAQPDVDRAVLRGTLSMSPDFVVARDGTSGRVIITNLQDFVMGRTGLEPATLGLKVLLLPVTLSA
jgi:hypothetical protein